MALAPRVEPGDWIEGRVPLLGNDVPVREEPPKTGDAPDAIALTGDGGWEHRITVPANRAQSARTIIENWLALTRLDAVLE